VTGGGGVERKGADAPLVIIIYEKTTHNRNE